MFTRVVECHINLGKKEEFSTRLRNEVLPLLQKQPGFVDVIGLVHDSDPERTLALSFWKNKEDADRYAQQHYRHVLEILKPYLQQDPKIDGFHVDTSTTHKIVAGKAA